MPVRMKKAHGSLLVSCVEVGVPEVGAAGCSCSASLLLLPGSESIMAVCCRSGCARLAGLRSRARCGLLLRRARLSAEGRAADALPLPSKL